MLKDISEIESRPSEKVSEKRGKGLKELKRKLKITERIAKKLQKNVDNPKSKAGTKNASSHLIVKSCISTNVELNIRDQKIAVLEEKSMVKVDGSKDEQGNFFKAYTGKAA